MSDSAVLAAIAALDNRFATRDGKLTTFDGNLTALACEVTNFREDVLGSFDRVENRLNGFRDDIVVNRARADRAHEAADDTCKELRRLSEEVTVLTRKQRRMETQLDDLMKRA